MTNKINDILCNSDFLKLMFISYLSAYLKTIFIFVKYLLNYNETLNQNTYFNLSCNS